MSEQSKAIELACWFEAAVNQPDGRLPIGHIADAAAELRRLDAENAALRAQLAQGEPVAEFNGENIRFIPFNGSPLPQAGYLYAAPQQAPVDERETMGAAWMEFSLKQKPYCTNVSQQDGFTAGWQARAALKPAVPEGYQLVPIEPTEDILNTLYDCPKYDADDEHLRATWAKLLAAAKDGEA